MFNKMKKIIVLLFAAVVVSSNAQNVAINATGAAPNTSAGLDIDFTNKGLLVPRVTLTSPTDAVTIPTPATGLMVFNTGSGGGLLPNYFYYNSGTPVTPNWVQISNTRKYSAIGTTDINTNATSAATAPVMTGLSISFTPQNSTVFVYFSCSGNLAGCNPGPGAANGYFDLYNGATKVTGTKCPLGSTDFNGNTSLIWNCVLVYPMTVVPGVLTTVSMKWFRDVTAAGCPASSTIVNNVVSGLNAHRTLFILD